MASRGRSSKATGAGQDIGYYTLPVIASFEGIDKQVNSKLSKAFGDVGKQTSKKFADSTEADLKRAGDAYTKMRDKALDAVGKVRTEEEKLKKLRDSGAGSDRIVVAEERLAKARRDSARINREAAAGHQDFLDIQKRLGSSSDQLGGRFSRLSGVAGSLGSALATAGGLAAGAALAGFTALAAGALTLGNRLYEVGQAFDDIADTITVKTGATGATLDSLTNSVKELGKSVPSSLGEIGNVVAETNRNLHLTGPALDAVAGTIANLNRLTGEQTDMRSLGKAFRGFGVDAKDQVPALDALFRASQKSGISVNDLLATVAKGGATMRQFGLDFGQSAALVATFEEAGLDGEKATMGLTKGLATLTKAGQTGKEALQNATGEIKRLIAAGDIAGAQDLTNKLFGGRGGAQFFELIKNGALDLDALTASMDDTGLSINQTSEQTADWSERWQILKNKALDALEPVGSKVFELVNDKLASLATWVDTHQPQIVNFFSGVGQAAIAMTQAIVQAAGMTIKALGDIAGGIGDLYGASLRVNAAFQRLTALPGSAGDEQRAYADRLDAQADAAFGWGESLQQVGDKLIDSAGKMDNWKTELDKLIKGTEDADKNVGNLGNTIGRLPAQTDVKVNVTDQQGNPIQPGTIGGIPMPGLVNPGGAALPPGGIPGVHGGGNAYMGPANAGGSARDFAHNNAMPFWQGQGFQVGDHAADKYGEHQNGAVDVMVPSIAAGQQVLAQALKDPNVYGVIFNNKTYGYGHGTTPQDYTAGHTGNPTQDHQDHVHIWYKPGGKDNIVSGTQPGGFPGQGFPLPWGNLPPLAPAPGGSRGPGGWFGGGAAAAPTGAPAVPAPPPATAPTSAPMPSGGVPLIQNPDGTWTSTDPAWAHLIARESGGINTPQQITDANGGPGSPNAAQGLFQITPDTWRRHGGTEFAPTPLQATPQQQAIVAARILQANPSGSDWGAGLPGREDPKALLAGLSGSSSSTTSPLSLSANQSPLSPQLNNAFGAGYEPGIGTPGYNEYGDPGYFEVDPKQVREAQERRDDAQTAIADADAQVAQARARRDELDITAKESERQAADDAVRQAEDRAKKARREAADAETDLAETQKGKFTEAKKASSSGKGGGKSDLSPVGSILGGFLKETFGMDGSFLPDLASLAPVQMAGTLLEAFSGPLMGALTGNLGIQQTGWQPGMPVNGMQNDTGIGGGSGGGGLFGIPDVVPPPMPADGQHGGTGAMPGPNVVINNDASTTVQGSVGMDPDAFRKQQQRAQDRGLSRLLGFPAGLR